MPYDGYLNEGVHMPAAGECSCLCTPCAEYRGCQACPNCTDGCTACGYPYDDESGAA